MQILKRLGAGFLGAVMTGASLLVPAMAADLSAYPAPFVTDGTTNFLMVVGADASPADVVGAINIAVRLGAEPGEEKTVSTSGGQQTITEGVDLGLSGDLIYFNDTFSKDVLTKTDMPTILADGTFTDDDGTNYDYTQNVDLGTSARFFYVKYDTDKDPELIVDLSSTSSSSPLYTLKVTFSKTVAFNSTKSEGQTITLFGKEYTVASDTDSTKLVLYGSSQSVTLNKDEETTVAVGGTDYTIKVIGFDTSNDKVILSVNGNTNDIAEGSSKKIGGLEVYAKTVTSWDNGNAGIAILQLGSQKLTFEDGQPVQEGDDNTDIDGTQVDMTTNPGSLSTLNIKVYKPDSDNDYIAMGSDNAFVDPVFGSFKITFAGVSSELTADARDQIKLRTSGDNKAYVEATDKNGNTADIYYAYDSSGTISLQDDNQKNIYVIEGAYAEKDEYIFLTPGDEKYTHMVKVKKIYEHATKGYAEFTDVFSGETYKTATGDFNDTGDTRDLVVDGKTYTVTLDATNDKVSVTYADSKTTIFPAIELANGEKLAFISKQTTGLNIPNTSTIILPTNTKTGWALANGTNGSTFPSGQATYWYKTNDDANLTQITVNGMLTPGILVVEEKDNPNSVENIIYVVTSSGGTYITHTNLTFTGANTGAVSTETDNVEHYVDYYGTFVVKDATDSHHTIYTLYYPDEQMYALVGAGSEVTVGGGTGTVTYEQVVPIEDNIARLDTDAAVEQAKLEKDLILVGGPAVNRLTAQALGLSYPSYGAASTVPENAAMIKLVENAFTTGKVALVVAGWEAENTQAACRVLQQYTKYPELTGTAVKVTGTTTPVVEALITEEAQAEENQTSE
ncbi:MAG: hypothetical protein B6U88_00035 [Candidatus Aenigmarchaeota archaeon ex4484_56]|nr:MAG: hypothetical protein B6U88_00035 [Candidatus Aenigmarchaeota archaeon ex4484_56]